MSLKTKHGDLFSHVVGPCIIVHGCNAQGVMGSGFAGQIRKRYPEAYEVYRRKDLSKKLTLGSSNGFQYENGLMVVNAITQEFYGRDVEVVYVNYEAVRKSLSLVAKGSIFYQLPVHLPLIGGGLANGNHETLIGIFEEVFKDSDATLWLL